LIACNLFHTKANEEDNISGTVCQISDVFKVINSLSQPPSWDLFTEPGGASQVGKKSHEELNVGAKGETQKHIAFTTVASSSDRTMFSPEDEGFNGHFSYR
jgi:hypothetical protein